MKEYQVVEGASVEQLNVKIAELGVKGWKALTMRCVPLNRPSGEVLATNVSTQNQVALYVLMELDLTGTGETVSGAGR
jgi:hypothetical protein